MPNRATGDREASDAQALLTSQGAAKRTVGYRRGEVIFRQGDPCESVFYIQKGQVKLSVLSKTGKQAIVAMLGRGDFFGEGGLAGQPVRVATATAVAAATIVFLDQDKMIRLLHEDRAMADLLVAHLLKRAIRLEEDLVDHLFSSSEKRLARKLLLLARYNSPHGPVGAVPPISQETLAEWVGTTRSRVNMFMKKFERLGFIDQTHGLKVHRSLMTLALHN